MAARKKITVAFAVGLIFCLLWLVILQYTYSSHLFESSIDLSDTNSYKWEVRPLRTDTYDLVVRLHKTIGPPYEYVNEIVDSSKFRDALLNLKWQLLLDQEVLSSGNRNTYGNHFRATNPYVEKGIGKIQLISGKTYLLKIQVNEPAAVFNELKPEIRIAPTVKTTDWVFSQTLVWGFISVVIFGFLVSMLVADVWLRTQAANKRMQSDAAKPRR